MHAANAYDILAQAVQLPDMTGIEIAREGVENHARMAGDYVHGRWQQQRDQEALRRDLSSYGPKDFGTNYLHGVVSLCSAAP